MPGTIFGDLRAVAGSSARVFVRIVVIDKTASERKKEIVLARKAGDLVEKTIFKNFTGKLDVLLEAGHDYAIRGEVTARCDVDASNLSVLPKSDFLNGDRRMVVDNISVNF